MIEGDLSGSEIKEEEEGKVDEVIIEQKEEREVSRFGIVFVVVLIIIILILIGVFVGWVNPY